MDDPEGIGERSHHGSGQGMTTAILVFDIGTTSVKAALFDDSGNPIASASVPYETEYPQSGWAQQHPNRFWEAAVAASRTLMQRCAATTSTIVAIGLTGHMNGCVLVDRQGNPIHPALIHADSRSTGECDRLDRLWGQQEMYRRTGNRIDEHLSLPKLMWLEKYRQSEFSKSAWFLNAKDYLRFKLTGQLGTTDYSDASLTGAFDQQRQVWDTEVLESLELPLHLFPHPKASTELDGTLSRESAVMMGLTEGIPVSVGGGDAACATRGAGVLGTRQAYGAIGSSAWISTLAENPVPDQLMRMQHFLDLEGRLYNVCGTVQSAGIALDWIRHLLGENPSETSDSYEISEGLLRSVPIGSSGVLFIPYLMGERTPHWDANARGAYIGLSLSTDKPTLLRATYEGVAFALRDCMNVYAELGIDIRSFTLLGGGVRSPFWQEIIGETLGIPLHRHPYPTQATALGAALAAGVAVGMWKDISEAIAKTTKDYEQVSLDHDRMRSYGKAYQVYERVYPSLKSIYRDLGTIRDTLVKETKKEVFI
ncbi:MAG: hypothetical protein CVV48_12235 [Spirochaetae bacterium HGW-Spirochaetae-4]|nr:MAG: hypothetical protein CVV48_12235 [Spirochaetae bacterium HGW-Spirochaetae-4]